MWTKGQGVQAADAALGSYNAQLVELRSEATSVAADQKVISAELTEALNELAGLLLPDATQATLALAETEVSLPLSQQRQELEQKRGEWARKLAEIERDAHFVQRQSLLHHTQGGFVREKQRCEAALSEAEQRIAWFKADESFQWLEARALRREIETGALASFWDTVTFGGFREDKAKSRCAAALGFASYEELDQSYKATLAAQAQASEQKAHVEKQRSRLLKLLERHGNLYAWTHDFEGRLCAKLTQNLAAQLSKVDLQALHGRIRESARPAVARAHALQKKLDYMQNLIQFLEREIDDREQRTRAIQQTRTTWAMKPWEPVKGNKAKWLVTLPEAKRASTHKQVRFSRRLHHNVVDYDDYDDYGYYMAHSHTFLAYDAFAYAADEPMPYEGFSRGILPEIAAHRATHHLERADLGAYRSLDKQAAREEAAEARAAERASAASEPRDAERIADEDAGSERDDLDSLPDDSETDGSAGDGDSETDLSEASASAEVEDAGADTADAS